PVQALQRPQAVGGGTDAAPRAADGPATRGLRWPAPVSGPALAGHVRYPLTGRKIIYNRRFHALAPPLDRKAIRVTPDDADRELERMVRVPGCRCQPIKALVAGWLSGVAGPGLPAWHHSGVRTMRISSRSSPGATRSAPGQLPTTCQPSRR